MKITDAFLAEHAMLYAQFDYLQQATPAAANLAVVHSQAATMTATLASHAHLEDELLFTALDAQMGPMGPVAVMRMEHDQIEALLEQVLVAQELAAAQRLMQQTLQLARIHFAKEEQVLFPMAQQVLDERTLTQLAGQWAQRRGVPIG
ncbi:MAG TPA: hemerythrin domain-containing protein [Anaerolineae bacterium]|nr:hemerythrin domain-containing protein [Anaerolineae bacterium]